MIRIGNGKADFKSVFGDILAKPKKIKYERRVGWALSVRKEKRLL